MIDFRVPYAVLTAGVTALLLGVGQRVAAQAPAWPDTAMAPDRSGGVRRPRRRHRSGGRRPAHHLRGRRQRRRVSQREQRRDLGAGVRQSDGTTLSIGDIAIAPSDPQRRVGGHGRGEQPPELDVGRRRLSLARRRHDVASTWGCARRRASAASSSIRAIRTSCSSRRSGHLFGPERGARPVSHERRRRDVAESARRRREHGRDDVAIAPDGRTLFAATYQRRRRAFGFAGGGPGERPLALDSTAATRGRVFERACPTGDIGPHRPRHRAERSATSSTR